jgi:hypothetical protein
MTRKCIWCDNDAEPGNVICKTCEIEFDEAWDECEHGTESSTNEAAGGQ